MADVKRETDAAWGRGGGGGVAGIEVVRQILAEAQGAVLPLVSQLDGLRWVFLGLALAGIAVTAWARVDEWMKRTN
jgi:zinc D-Ala-D-Ala carboxypeptidase